MPAPLTKFGGRHRARVSPVAMIGTGVECATTSLLFLQTRNYSVRL
jgi:hypothetical protein